MADDDAQRLREKMRGRMLAQLAEGTPGQLGCTQLEFKVTVIDPVMPSPNLHTVKPQIVYMYVC